MGKRIEGGIICVVTASQWVALFFAFHHLQLPAILTLLLSVYLSHHRQGCGVGVGYGEETRSGCLCHHDPSSSPRPPSGSGGAMAALHLSSRRCRHSLPLRVLPRRRSPCEVRVIYFCDGAGIEVESTSKPLCGIQRPQTQFSPAISSIA